MSLAARSRASSLSAQTVPPSMLTGYPLGGGDGDTELPGFARLWSAFMSARLLIAAAILGLHVAVHFWVRPLPLWILGVCAIYLAMTILVRVLATPRGPGRSFDRQWAYTAGVDLAFFVVLQAQQLGGVNYVPLVALPVLMSAVLGSRALALGTAALVTLILLAQSLWNNEAGWGSTGEIAQAGLAGAGMLILALLTNQLSARLAREEAAARRSRVEAHVQSLVNGMVIDAMDDGVLVVDTDYMVRSANPAARLMLGSDQEVTPDQFALDDNPAWLQLAHIARQTFEDEPVDAMEVTLHHEDRHSSRLQVRTQRTPTVSDSGRCLCVMFMQDLREMEAQLRTEKLAGMGRMSAAVAHEIRNPLAAISQANALLEEDLTDPALLRLTTMVRQNADRLGHIVEDVLDVVRAQGPADPHAATDTLELDALVHRFCGEWIAQHGAGARVQLHLGMPELPVVFSPEHLRRILVNLLDNGARYATHQDGAIQVSTHTVRHGPAMLMVWSDGPPLEPSVRRHLFEPFFSSESRSSGLGLFICRELCERHGASIGYERTRRAQGGVAVDGNEFFLSLRRAPGAFVTTFLDSAPPT